MGGHGAASGPEALARTRDADRLIWSTNSGRDLHRRERNLAVAEALTGGISIDQVADYLGVRIKDVEQMAASTDVEAGSLT